MIKARIKTECRFMDASEVECRADRGSFIHSATDFRSPCQNPARMSTTVSLSRNSNQALGIGQFAIDFLAGSLGPGPSNAVLARTKLFHSDSVLCGVSALAL